MTDINIENEEVETVEDDSVRGSLVAALEEIEARPEDEEKPDRSRDETGKFAKKEEVEVEAQPVAPPPESWTPEAKAEWAKVPASLQAQIAKREADVHKMFTASDGELRMGRTIKEIASPYIPMIQAEGGTVEGAFKDLLNSAYILRTGSQEQKAQLLLSTAQQFGVDLSGYTGQQENPNQVYQALQREIQELRQIANPEVIKNQLREEQETANIQNEVQAFAGNPANVHFQTVKPLMAALLGSRQAKDLQEAYDMACHASPSIRSTLSVNQDTKRKEEIVKKKQAAVSITGSPSQKMANSSSPKNSVREELEAAFDEAYGSTV